MTHAKSWADDMTETEKSLYMAETKVLQLIDHIIKGNPDIYFVHDAHSGYGPYTDYGEALAKFNDLSEGYCHIYLATRIGTGVVIQEKNKP